MDDGYNEVTDPVSLRCCLFALHSSSGLFHGAPKFLILMMCCETASTFGSAIREFFLTRPSNKPSDVFKAIRNIYCIFSRKQQIRRYLLIFFIFFRFCKNSLAYALFLTSISKKRKPLRRSCSFSPQPAVTTRRNCRKLDLQMTRQISFLSSGGYLP